MMRRTGRRGAFLAFLALLDLLYGYSLLAAPVAGLHRFDLLLPPQAWAGLWIVTGVTCAAGVPMRIPRDRFAFATAAAMKVAWAGLFAWLQLAQHFPRAWVSVIIWAAFAATVLVVASWPEAPPIPPSVPVPPLPLLPPRPGGSSE